MNTNLLDAILLHLRQTPCGLLRNLCAELRVSRRTIENSVHLGTGKTFREVRKEILLDHVNCILAANPAISVKELSFAVGFKSASSFSRAIKRACGSCPKELRSHTVRESSDFVSISS
jgi:transcriptional regulator GlxA family with amidase domain